MANESAGDLARLHRRGVFLILAAALLWSVAGLFSRVIPADLWTMQFGRSLAGGVFLLAVTLALHGRATARVFHNIGGLGLAAVPVLALSMLCFIAALKTTSVAQVMIIYATQPFVSAAIAWVLLREPMGRGAMIASAAALLGIAVTFYGASWDGPVMGSLLALLMVVTFGFVLVLARGRRDISMNALTCAACLLCAAACWPLSQTASLTWGDAAMLALFGFLTVGLGMTLLMIGAKDVPAGEASLFSAMDVPLSPLWVWLALGERPSQATLIGGAVVLAALFWHLFNAQVSGPSRSAGGAV